MNKSLYFIVFVAGAVAGSVATWQCTKKIYEQMAQEEIDSVKETFSRLKEKHMMNQMTNSHHQLIHLLILWLRQLMKVIKLNILKL